MKKIRVTGKVHADIPRPGNYEMLGGNLASIGIGGIVSVIASLIVC